MNRIFSTLIHAALLLVLIVSPGLAADPRFEGSWLISGVSVAPWEDPENPMPDGHEADYIGKIVRIGVDFIEGPKVMGCDKTEFSVDDLPFLGLFEGGLGNDPQNGGDFDNAGRAATLAASLGFTAEPVPTLSSGCSEIQFHLADAGTILFALDNRIYTMKRQ